MNFGREYRYDWHDLMMEIEGEIAGDIQNDFNSAWEHAGKLGDLAYLTKIMNKNEVKEGGGKYWIRPLYTTGNNSEIFKSQVEAIKRAGKYIYISNAYFSDDTIIHEILKASKRGVDVRVILPVHGNHEIMNKNNIVVANTLFENGIKVYFYPGMSHIKAAIYDGWLCTGSANFDKLSFVDNLEFNLATSDPQAVKAITEQLFEPDFKKSTLMKAPLKAGLKDHLAEILAGQL
jgi:cardiolipin synthase